MYVVLFVSIVMNVTNKLYLTWITSIILSFRKVS